MTHPVWPWIAEHGGFLLTRFEVGRDRKTAYERLRGKSAKVQDLSFEVRFGKMTCMWEDAQCSQKRQFKGFRLNAYLSVPLKRCCGAEKAMDFFESTNQRNTRKCYSHSSITVHRRGITEIFPHKRVFDVDRVSSLIDIDQRHTVDFRIHSGSVALWAERKKHVPNNSS